MSSESVAAETESNAGFYRRIFWFLIIGGLMTMLPYEYKWSWFAFHAPGISFGRWFSTSSSIMGPGFFCLAALRQLRKTAKEGTISYRLAGDISFWVVFALYGVYLWFVPDIQQLSSLGVFK